MFYNELNQILLREKKGYIINLKYDRFAQVNFPGMNKSLIVISDFKDFEIVSNPDNIQLIVRSKDKEGNDHISTYDVYTNQLNNEEYKLFNTNKGNVMVIAKAISNKVHVDGLMIVNNKDTASTLVAYFSPVREDVIIKIPFTESEMEYLTKFVNKAGRMITNMELGNINTVIENNNESHTTSTQGVTISIRYNVVHELCRTDKGNQKITEKTMKKIKAIQESDTMISDEELTELLEEYSEMSQESKFWFVETEYTEEDYLNEYSRLCEDVKRDYHNDGKVEFIYDPSVRNAITDKNCELR